MSLTRDLKDKAKEVGFALVGVSSPERLRSLRHGPVGKITNLRSVEEEFPSPKSVVLLGFHAWDKAYNLAISAPDWLGYGMHDPKERFEWYQFYYEIVKNMAWNLIDFLRKRGFESTLSLRIPLKPAAVIAGLGYQGKNTLLVTPNFGPRVRLISVLTTAELELDEPFTEDLCKYCQKCVIACPTKALKPYKLTINRCMTYSAESPSSPDVENDVRALERKLLRRPSPHSYMECTICIDACPIGKPH